jgi:mono/diheme cytochrome c family protein
MLDSAPLLTSITLLTRILLLGKYPVSVHWRGELPQDLERGAEPVRPPISRRSWVTLTLIIVVIILCGGAAYLYNELRLDREQRHAAIAMTGGDPNAAPALIIRFGCAGCHAISGVAEAAGRLGPPLNNLARQGYVGGVVPNTTDNLIQWIVDPRSIDPMSAMPRTGISTSESRDIAAYLLSLRG